MTRPLIPPAPSTAPSSVHVATPLLPREERPTVPMPSAAEFQLVIDALSDHDLREALGRLEWLIDTEHRVLSERAMLAFRACARKVRAELTRRHEEMP